MLQLQNYANSSSEASSTESENENDEKNAHLKPIDPSFSVAKSLQICAAPVVVPIVSARIIASSQFIHYADCISRVLPMSDAL
jgi:hypothetical protein